MMFPTQYTKRERVICESGSPIHMTYGGYYDENGRVQLQEKGQENIYEFIQSHADSVDINVLLARYNNGDVTALSRVQGVYMDATEFPSNFAEALNYIDRMREAFMSLPVDVRSTFNHSFSEFLAASTKPDFFSKFPGHDQTASSVDDVKEVTSDVQE